MSEEYLEHHGVLGQKWGVRRYQNTDGSLTAAGKRRVYAQGADGGYESFRHRHRRAIEAAKYENDLKKNQKKLDKAYEKGNEKKIAKYTKAEGILNKNREIYIKDLSPEAIQMGRDYITMMKTGVIATALGGPFAGAGAGLAVRAINKMADTEKKVYAQEAERKKDWKEVEKAKKAYVDYQINQPADEYSPMYSQKLAKDYQDKKQEYNDKLSGTKKSTVERGTPESAKNFDKYVKEHGGKLDWANFPSHDRDGAPTYNWTDKQKEDYIKEYNSKKH